MDPRLADIYTEPEPDPDTLANLGPLRGLAGRWEGAVGVDEHPVANGVEGDAFVERYDLEPIDPQTNGPQLFYGLRYHTHVVRPGEVATFHDQVGYWLWEPVTCQVLLSVAIPRGQVLLASGVAEADSTTFEVSATEGRETNGIFSNPFLQEAFRTTSFRMQVTLHPDDTWSYEQDTVLKVFGRDLPFHHTDRNTLRRLAPSQPNPLAAG
jgi:hypothetical protein